MPFVWICPVANEVYSSKAPPAKHPLKETMIKKLMVLASVVILQACGTTAYTPTENTLQTGDVTAFNVNGKVSITNGQPSKDPVIVYSYGGSKLGTNLHDITEVLARQAQSELEKNGRISGSGGQKTIKVRVTYLMSEYVAFWWKSKIRLEAVLGDGEVREIAAFHGSGNLFQDLNGCIADGVIELFKDEKVKAYLAN
jgi:hypothetical protein